jgi:hypothetical protein
LNGARNGSVTLLMNFTNPAPERAASRFRKKRIPSRA